MKKSQPTATDGTLNLLLTYTIYQILVYVPVKSPCCQWYASRRGHSGKAIFKWRGYSESLDEQHWPETMYHITYLFHLLTRKRLCESPLFLLFLFLIHNDTTGFKSQISKLVNPYPSSYSIPPLICGDVTRYVRIWLEDQPSSSGSRRIKARSAPSSNSIFLQYLQYFQSTTSIALVRDHHHHRTSIYSSNEIHNKRAERCPTQGPSSTR